MDAMTSKQVKLSRVIPRWLIVTVLIAAAGATWGCRKQIAQPTTFPTPYPGPKMWAVVPFRNETGIRDVDTARLADKLTNHLLTVADIDVVPVNRVIEAMTVLEMRDVQTVGEAMKLLQTMDLDGLIVGTATAWDPYEPPKIGLIVQLYTQDRPGYVNLDPYELQRAGSDDILPGLRTFEQPIAMATMHLDAANGEVLALIQAYAKGRTPPQSPAGWRRYLLSMDLYSEFVAHEAMRRLFKAEWQRLTAGRQTEAVASEQP